MASLPLKRSALIIVLLIGAASVLWHWSSQRTPPVTINTATVTVDTIEDVVSALGKLAPYDYVDVGAQVSGQLTAVHVRVGDVVTQGQLLAEIDASVQQARVDAGLAELDALSAQRDQQRAQLALAELQYERQQRLYAEQATSDDALQSAQANLAVAKAQISVLDAQLRQRRSSVTGDQALLDFARIYAPRSGTVVSLEAQAGQTINASQVAPQLMRIADLSKMTVATEVSEADIGRLTPGMPVYFSTLSHSDQRIEGTLSAVLPTPEVINNVVLYTALFDVDNSRGQLMSGMTAQVFFVVQRAENAAVLPVAAVQTRGGQTGVERIVSGSDETEWLAVTTGPSNRIHVVVEGVEPGTEVLLPAVASRTSSRESSSVRRRGLF